MTPVVALLPSPLLGPAVWEPVAATLTDRGWPTLVSPVGQVRTPDDVLASFLTGLPLDRDLVLVAHSNAGAYVPALAGQRRVVATVFVDAVLPPTSGGVGLAPPALLAGLRDMADNDGRLPVWTRWWAESDVAALFPDDETRTRVESEQQRLPISYFEATVPVPQGWEVTPGSYLGFGDTYAPEQAEAARRGWTVRTLPGGHLHMLVDPQQVATALIALIDKPVGPDDA